MSVTVSPQETPNDPAPSTLGAVLYVEAARLRPTEAQWVALLRATEAGDQIAFGELYGRTHRLVFTLIMRIVRSKETAEELTLDVFHDIWRRAGSFDGKDGTVLGWIMNQARSRAIDRLRFETRKKRVDPYAGGQPTPAVEPASDELLQGHQRAQWLRDALARLTSDERQAIEIAYFGECSYAEVATRLSQPPGTIKTRIRAGLMKLRAALGREGGGS